MDRNSVIILGAGSVSGPVIDYLKDNYAVTVLDTNESSLARLDGVVETQHVDGSLDDALQPLLPSTDLVISLLPATLHHQVARQCLDHSVSLVTASYVSPEMQELDQEAQQKGLLFLNEVGLDPGIDHMSAMKMFDTIHVNGGRIRSFASYCGGLPSVASNNPFGYQLSWSPQGVLLASTNGARFLENGETVEIPPGDLFKNSRSVVVPGKDVPFEGYFNRDSLGYIPKYGLEDEVQTFVRGTLRYFGWCETLQAMADLGAMDTSRNITGKTPAEIFTSSDPQDTDTYESARRRVAEKLSLSADHPVHDRLEWLGMYESLREMPQSVRTPFDATVELMVNKMLYQPGQTDMVILQHEVVAEYEGDRLEGHVSTLEFHGQQDGDTAMARTVGLPVAYAAELILEGKLEHLSGVQIPLQREFYEPILGKLAEEGIQFVEQTQQL